MKLLPWILQIILTIRTSYASPFALSDQYVEDFRKGIEELKKVSAEHQFQEGHFDPAVYNETESLKGKVTLKRYWPKTYISSLSSHFQMPKNTTS